MLNQLQLNRNDLEDKLDALNDYVSRVDEDNQNLPIERFHEPELIQLGARIAAKKTKIEKIMKAAHIPLTSEYSAELVQRVPLLKRRTFARYLLELNALMTELNELNERLDNQHKQPILDEIKSIKNQLHSLDLADPNYHLKMVKGLENEILRAENNPAHYENLIIKLEELQQAIESINDPHFTNQLLKSLKALQTSNSNQKENDKFDFEDIDRIPNKNKKMEEVLVAKAAKVAFRTHLDAFLEIAVPAVELKDALLVNLGKMEDPSELSNSESSNSVSIAESSEESKDSLSSSSIVAKRAPRAGIQQKMALFSSPVRSPNTPARLNSLAMIDRSENFGALRAKWNRV